LSEQHGTGDRQQTGGEGDLLVRLLQEAQHERATRPRPDQAGSPAGTPPRNSAFTKFVRLTEQRLAQHVLPLVRGDVHQAEDVVQETYLRVWKGLARFDPAKLTKGDPFAWLVKIAHNTAVSLARRRRPVPTSSVGAAAGAPALPEPVAPEAGPARQAEDNERDDALHRALAGLKAHKRLLLELHYRQELSHRDIADGQGLTTCQVNMTLYATRQELRARLEKYVLDDGD
jgi:RNA polymerase sigma-70 factor (ECF subfamily)